MTYSANENNMATIPNKEKKPLMAILTLWFFTGIIGGHRYYGMSTLNWTNF